MIRILDFQRVRKAQRASRSGRPGCRENVVRRLWKRCKRGGDAALLAMRGVFDDLGDVPCVLLLKRTAGRRRDACRRKCEGRETAIANIRQFAERQLPRQCFEEFSPWPQAGLDCSAAERGRMLRAFGPLSAALHVADDGGAGTDGRSAAHLRYLAEAIARDSGVRAPSGHRRDVSHRRRAGDRGDGFRNRNDRARWIVSWAREMPM